MRKISESFGNPGNSLAQGLTNHYTPIDNIIMNVRNIFGALLGLVVSKGEDGVSLKIQSSNFTNPDVTRDILYSSTFDGRTYLAQYIINQGLRMCKIIQVGSSCVAYFCPDDLADYAPVAGMEENKLHECEMTGLNKINEGADEEELEDTTQQEIAEIINNNDKIKAANDFAEKLKNVVELPENVYIKATKDAEGHESIALRYKYDRRRPFGGKTENVISLLNIYSTGANAVWVDAYLNKEMFSEDIINVIDSVLRFIGAKATSDECIWNIGEEDNPQDDEGGKMPKDNGTVEVTTEITKEEDNN